ncbi:MAG: DUF4847 family protein [Bacteroidaceae bacterium]|nr:DUF4847 family protein [Bacteroidaceae bacterium]
MKQVVKTIKRTIFAVALLACIPSCTSDDDIDDIFIERGWTLTYIQEGSVRRNTEGKKYSLLFGEVAFTATTPDGSTITGEWKADGGTRSFTCYNVRSSSNFQKDTIAKSMLNLLKNARKYEGDTHWLRIKQQENVYMLLGSEK